MFRWLFLYWYNPTDTPSLVSKINLWSYINIRTFKAKISTTILYFISGIENLTFRKLKIFYKTIHFDYFYIKFLIGFFYFTIFILVIKLL